jgi:hypothetical protein
MQEIRAMMYQWNMRFTLSASFLSKLVPVIHSETKQNLSTCQISFNSQVTFLAVLSTFPSDQMLYIRLK